MVGNIRLADIPTCMTPGEVTRLADLAAGLKVIEIGSWHGHSTIAMAKVAEFVLAIDWHQGDAHAGHEDTTSSYFENVTRSGLAHRIMSVVGRAEVMIP